MNFDLQELKSKVPVTDDNLREGTSGPALKRVGH